MGRQDVVGDLFRTRLRQERERHDMPRAQLAELMCSRYGLRLHPSAIAKVESGRRDVRIDELVAFADIFAISTDAFLGRHCVGAGADVMWAVSKLTGNAQKMVGDVVALTERLQGNADDLRVCAQRDNRAESVRQFLDAVDVVLARLDETRQALAELAVEFPLPGVDLTKKGLKQE